MSKKPVVTNDVSEQKPSQAEVANQANQGDLAARQDQLEGQIQQLAKQNMGILDVLGEISKTLAKNTSVETGRYNDAMEYQIGQDETVDFIEADDGLEIERPAYTDPDTPHFKEAAAYEAFMKEPVRVLINDTSERHADPVIEISVNGNKAIFVRGQEKVVPRFIVEGLARAKPVAFKNEEYTDPRGIRAVRNPGSSGLRYPFSVVADRNPLGKRWLKSILAQPS
jgi:hypothetical protein